ncbi:MAG TPA: hypothetical protein VKP08_12330 [Anaerolineales bacterium]|nr:hypothetical protein [Anaerolineales bacterium]
MNRIGRGYRLLILFLGLLVILGCRSCVPGDMEFDVVASPSVFTGPGEVITYSYNLNNTNYVYFDFSVTDDKLGAVPCGSTRLEAGQTTVCQLSYTTTEQDVAAGVIKNTASAIGELQHQPMGWTEIDFEPVVRTDSVEVVYEPPQCQLQLGKSANPTTYLTAGEVIQYTYAIHNIGTAEVSGPFAVTDDKIDEWTCDDAGVEFNLCVDCFITCRGSYTVKASDVGSNIVNTAQAQGQCGAADQVIQSNPAMATVYYLMPTATSQAAQPKLTVTQSVNQTVYTKDSEVLVYTYTVQNTGQTAVTGPFELVDAKADQWECDPAGSLSVGGQLICKGYYRIRENDLCSSVTNTAFIKGATQGGSVTSNEVSTTVYSGRNCNPPKSDESDDASPGGSEESTPPPIIVFPWE